MCEVSFDGIEINEAAPILLDVGDDIEEEVGNEIIISVEISNLDAIQEIVWTANGEVICSGDTFECLDYEIIVPILETEYCVLVSDTLGCENVDCFTLSVDSEGVENEVIIEELISPNDDGINDKLVIDGFEENLADNHPRNKIIIFNRWGQAIYQASPYDNEWGGELNGDSGKLVPQGTYYYQFNFVEKPEGLLSPVRYGSVTVIR